MEKAPLSLAHGRHYLAIPGPSVMPDRVLQAMHRAAPNIYTGELPELVASLLPDLKSIAGTQHHVAMYICNGHGAWEASLANVLSRGDRVLALATGRFGLGWADVAKQLGAEVDILDFGREAPVDPTRVMAALEDDTSHKIKALLVVQVDTASSVKNDILSLRQAMDAVGHPALLMVDSIACLACDAMEMDAWGIDVLITGSQKGLMTPPGMGFVFFNDKADAARETASCVTAYWDWRPRVSPEIFYRYFFGTAPTHLLFGLREALTMLVHEEGMQAVLARHAALAEVVWAACDAWSAEGPLRLNIADPAFRSNAVSSIRIDAPHGKHIQDWLKDNAGVTLGIGLGMDSPEDPDATGAFRIGHMGHVNAHMVLGLLGTVEAAMQALDVPHGSGALSAAAKVVAEKTLG
ncbi:MAG: aminotransferase class V-fold PLP-dependent enzyme [Pseudomonadota bacterium]